MRILVDATSLLLRSAGVKNYTYHWLRALRQLAGPDSIQAFPFIGEPGPLNHEASLLAWWRTLPRLGLLHLANLPGLPTLDLLSSKADVFHMSNQLRRVPHGVRITATIHDLTCWRMPEMHTAANVRADRVFARRVLQNADGIIAVSENTRRDAVQYLHLDPGRIRVIYPGVDDRYFVAGEEDALAARRRYGLRSDYILAVGAIEPRKNLDRLLDAYHSLPAGLRRAIELVVAGPAGWGSTRTLDRLRAGEPGVRYLGYVPEADLPGIFRGAAAFVYPSLYEGFGFPVAQALAAGRPVVTANVSSLPEVAGDAALTVDPQSQAELARAIERILTTPSLAAELSRKARGQADRFRWENTARRSLEFFHGMKFRQVTKGCEIQL